MRRGLGVEIENLIGGAVEKSSLFPPKRYRTKGPTLYEREWLTPSLACTFL